MKYIFLILIILLASCQADVAEKTEIETEFPQQLTDEQILEQYNDDLDSALEELDLIE